MSVHAREKNFLQSGEAPQAALRVRRLLSGADEGLGRRLIFFWGGGRGGREKAHAKTRVENEREQGSLLTPVLVGNKKGFSSFFLFLLRRRRSKSPPFPPSI